MITSIKGGEYGIVGAFMENKRELYRKGGGTSLKFGTVVFS